jgi:NADH-quinone oxidoreductase subunit N
METLNLLAAGPELVLIGGAIALLMLGVFTKGEQAASLILWLAVGVLCAAGVFAYASPADNEMAFGGVFISDGMSRFAKLFIIFGSAVVLILSRDYMQRAKIMLFEFPVLVLMAVAGMAMMVSSADLISLYMGLELQSLSLYVLASFRRDSVRSTEAGLKYFVLGALSSGLLLFGSSFVYGYAGSTEFVDIAARLEGGNAGVGFLIGLALVIAGLAFKISAVPFHMWTPDVYEGAPTPITAFFATAPKVAAAVLMVRVLYGAFGEVSDQWWQIIWFLSAASMMLGGIAAIGQTDIKRLMAYSSIGHMGFAMTGLAAGTAKGAESVLIYLAIYLVMNIGVFAFILSMRRDGRQVTKIDDLAGLWSRDGLATFCLGTLMFSLAGIPPLAGFWAKFYVFQAAVDAGLIWLLMVAVVATVISCFYYLRIVKIMVFDDPADGFDGPMRVEHRLALVASAVLVLAFVVGGLGVPEMAAEAASTFAPQ